MPVVEPKQGPYDELPQIPPTSASWGSLVGRAPVLLAKVNKNEFLSSTNLPPENVLYRGIDKIKLTVNSTAVVLIKYKNIKQGVYPTTIQHATKCLRMRL